jgi:hypothetical protein
MPAESGVLSVAIEKYRQEVEEVMAEALADLSRAPRRFHNFGPDYAREVISTMLHNAQHEVLINSENLCALAYDSELLSDFLKKPNAVLKVAISNKDAWTDPASALSKIDAAHRAKIEVYLVTNPDVYLHFASVDGRDVRVETDHDKREADVFFSDYTLGEQAKTVFGRIISNATKLDNSLEHSQAMSG